MAQPNPADLGALSAIFDDTRHPFDEHRLAAWEDEGIEGFSPPLCWTAEHGGAPNSEIGEWDISTKKAETHVFAGVPAFRVPCRAE